MNTVFVFVGPTLTREQAQAALPQATVLPPAQRGDVTRLVVEYRPSVIVLIDGLFDTVPSVCHKEILFALTKGVRVFGAASMGALRAAELWTFGMEGMGEIFERFKLGVWEADDEVAVIHGPAETGFRARSVSLATIRLALETACERRFLQPADADRIAVEMQRVFYTDRCWDRVLACATAIGLDKGQVRALAAFIANESPDAKRDDALSALLHVRDLCQSNGPIPPPTVEFDFEPSIYWEQLLTDVVPTTCATDSLVVTNPRLERDAQIQQEAHELWRGAALLYLLLEREQRQERVVQDDAVQLALRHFRRRRRLENSDQARTDYHAQELTDEELRLLAWLDVALAAVVDEAGGALSRLLGLELKRRGDFARAKRRVIKKQEVLRQYGVNSLSLEDLGLDLPRLMDWYQSAFQTIEGSLQSHADALGFESVRDFLNEVMLEHELAEQAVERT